jgi:hypothetical protein
VTRSDKALRSFFGARVGGQNRPQSINTPQFLIDAIIELWPEGINLDPCSNPESIVPAKIKLFEYGETSGLHAIWPTYTYANPPYENLKVWLRKLIPGAEHLMLCPVRTNRTWWCHSAGQSTRVCWLLPFAFIGHTSTFPAPLAMLYYGSRSSRFEEIFSRFGSVGVFKIYEQLEAQITLQI